MQDSERSLKLLLLTLGILLLPKLFAYVLAIMDTRQRRGFGGALILLAGVLIETVLSSLFAHIMMLLQSTAVADVFRGRDSGWKPQRRGDGSLPTAEIMQFHSKHMVIGACLAALTLYSSFILFLWMLPASLGLVFSGPLSAWSAQRSAGEAFRRLGAPSDTRRRRRRPRSPAKRPRFKRGSKKPFWSARRSRNWRRAANCAGSIASSFKCSRSRWNPAFLRIWRLDALSSKFPQI